jgi:aminoglycoside 3-N-acetyltransferase
MANLSIKNKILAFSPHIEMLVRHLYWKNIRVLNKFPIKKLFNKLSIKKTLKKENNNLNYNEIAKFLESSGLAKGSLLVIHSAYGSLKGKGKTPDEILDFFIDIVGENGTLAMPAMPSFPNDLEIIDYLNTRAHLDKIFEYNPETSGVTTGVLPSVLTNRSDAIRSKFPINTMVALGRLSQELFCDEFSQLNPLACGIGSSWKKCLDNEAIIVSLGTDLTHSLTSIHVAEDSWEDSWPVDNWYHKKNFKLINADFSETIAIRERAPMWGALHYAERTLCKDLINAGLLKTKIFDGVEVEIIKAKELNNFLRNQQQVKKGYPYYWV